MGAFFRSRGAKNVERVPPTLVLHGDEDPLPARFVSRQDAGPELDVEPAAGQGIVDGLADDFGAAVVANQREVAGAEIAVVE